MSAAVSTSTGRRRSDLALVWSELKYEQRAFWRNPFAAAFSVGFSVVFLILLGLSGGNDRISFLGNVRTVQYYVPGFLAYGVMATCFNVLAITLVGRRELGLLKRLRLSPLPTRIYFAALLLNALVVSTLQIIALMLIGRLAYNVAIPGNPLALVLAIVVGVVTFAALGIGASGLIPNQEAAGPVLSIVFFVLLYLSGLWFPLQPGSALARISAWFPVRHFIIATFAPYDPRPHANAFAWHDLFVLGIWAVIASFVAVRRFKWEPRRS
ncbi:MAG TPA: ABC transporter permease [Acidimicrobiia bacterium]|jgi:ABC-2 type transport system permease protein